jgi:replicative DNA helicase
MIDDDIVVLPERPHEPLPPSNVEAEEAVLGALLIDPAAIVAVASTLSPEDFLRPAHRRIYAAMLDLYVRRQAVDYLTTLSELERAGHLDEAGGAVYLTELIERVPTAAHVEHYARLVERASVLRRLIRAAGQIAQLAYRDQAENVEELIDRAERILFSVSQLRLERDLTPISHLLDEYFQQIEHIHAHRGQLIGTASGFYDLDRVLGGLQPSDLIIVAGRPGMGKTSWLLSLAARVALDQKAVVALFSLEMSAEQLVQRLIASETGVSSHRLRQGQMSDDEFPLVTEAIGRLAEAPIFIDDSAGVTAFELRTKARRLHAEHPLGLVVVDYLQLMSAGVRVENRVQEISLISRSLKALARELKVPVVAASQLSRAVEARAEHKPQLSDLRESGSIEQDADVVLFIYRDEIYNPHTPKKNIAEVSVAKHRNGPLGSVELGFIQERTKFVNLHLEPEGLPYESLA